MYGQHAERRILLAHTGQKIVFFVHRCIKNSGELWRSKIRIYEQCLQPASSQRDRQVAGGCCLSLMGAVARYEVGAMSTVVRMGSESNADSSKGFGKGI